MGKFTIRWYLSLLLPTLAASGFVPQATSAQQTLRELDRTQFGIGYVANAPDELGGVGGYVVFPKWGGIGLYVDYKWDLSNPADSEEFVGTLTAEEVPFEVPSAHYLERTSSSRGFNVALVRPVSSFLMLYGGAGLKRRTRFESFQDPTGTMGRLGVFWVESTAGTENRMNVLFGLMMRVGPSVTSHFGIETEPRGITAGVSLRFPRW
jgi:hypothetical protein